MRKRRAFGGILGLTINPSGPRSEEPQADPSVLGLSDFVWRSLLGLLAFHRLITHGLLPHKGLGCPFQTLLRLMIRDVVSRDNPRQIEAFAHSRTLL